MDIDPNTAKYRNISRAVHASIRGGEHELFLHKCENILENADVRLKHRIGVTDEALADIYRQWHPDLDDWITNRNHPGKETWNGFMAFKDEIDLIKSMMSHFNYPEQPRPDIARFVMDDDEVSMTRALEETRFRAAVAFWDTYFHRFVFRDGKVYYVIPPSQEVGDNNPVIVPVPIETIVSDLLFKSTVDLDCRTQNAKLKKWIAILFIVACTLLIFHFMR